MTRIDEGMMTLEEACEYVGVSQVTIMRYIRENKLKAWKVANRLRFYQEDLDEAFKKPVTGSEEA